MVEYLVPELIQRHFTHRFEELPPAIFLEHYIEERTLEGRRGRKGSVVTNRTQFRHSNGNWVKRNRSTGQIIDQKTTSEPFKGLAKEPDGRQDKPRPIFTESAPHRPEALSRPRNRVRYVASDQSCLLGRDPSKDRRSNAVRVVE
jgi:hypothetical protein